MWILSLSFEGQPTRLMSATCVIINDHYHSIVCETNDLYLVSGMAVEIAIICLR